MTPQPRPNGSDLRLVYKGDGDYNVEAGGVVIELSYDGSDYSVGDWTFWNVRVGDHRFGGSQVVGPGSFRDWLEVAARTCGKLPDEPEAADAA